MIKINVILNSINGNTDEVKKEDQSHCYLQMLEDTKSRVFQDNPGCHVLMDMLTNWQILSDVCHIDI